MKYRLGIKAVENFVRFELEVSAIVGDIFIKLFHNFLHQLILETMVSPTLTINVFSSHIFITKYYCPMKRVRVSGGEMNWEIRIDIYIQLTLCIK